jgi:ubiquinone/menaquinone biosynthesis C-methylase UbiE
MKTAEAIDIRYTSLSKSSCCLSCGGAINYAHPEAGETCLDLGSGRGTDCIRLAEQVGPTGYVFGIDISDGMIEKAKQNVAEKGITTIEFIKSPIEIIPKPDNSVNLIISNCTLNHANDKNAVWKEVFRVLKKQGRFVVSDIYSLEPVPAKYSNDPVAVSECWAGAITRDEYLQILTNTGFTNIEILEESKPYEKGQIVVSSFTIRGYKSVN